MKTQYIKNFFLYIIIISIPFLDFFNYNLGNIDERTDLAVNSLTVQRLLTLFFGNFSEIILESSILKGKLGFIG